MPRPLSQQIQRGSLLTVRVAVLACTSASSIRPVTALQHRTDHAASCPGTPCPVLVGPPAIRGGKKEKEKKGGGKKGRKERKKRKRHLTPSQPPQHSSGHSSSTRRLLNTSLAPLDSWRGDLRSAQKPDFKSRLRNFPEAIFSWGVPPPGGTAARGWQYHGGTRGPAAPAAGLPSGAERGRGEGKEKGKGTERAAPVRAQAGRAPSWR